MFEPKKKEEDQVEKTTEEVQREIDELREIADKVSEEHADIE